MPRGVKFCKKCECPNGPRAFSCKGCGESFNVNSGSSKSIKSSIKNDDERIVSLGFHRIQLTSTCVKYYDDKTTRLWEDRTGDYRIRYATKLSCGSPIAHEYPFTLIKKELVKDAFTGKTHVFWEMVGRHKSLPKAKFSCFTHSNKG